LIKEKAHGVRFFFKYPVTNMTSPNYLAIYKTVKKIPRGRVATYGQIAALAGMPRAARQVGYALRATPDNVKIPWHRVVNAQGRVSMRLKDWQSGGDDLQKILLEAEGVEFDETGKMNLKRYRWEPKV
jgi:methylated-DNA-protein-cysteine methyltransferase related protein